MGAQMAGQCTGVKIGDGHCAFALQVLGQGFLAAKIRCQQGQVLDDQSGGMNAAGLHVFLVHAGVADVGIGKRDDLLAVARIGEDLLVTGHRGVEHHLASGLAGCANGDACKDRAVG